MANEDYPRQGICKIKLKKRYLQFQFIIDVMGPLHSGSYSTLCASGPLHKGKSMLWGLKEEKGRYKGGIGKR